MTTIYIVKNDVGEYDDNFERSLCAVSTEEKAIELVSLFIELNNFNCAFEERIYNEFSRVWSAEHPLLTMPVKPKTPAGYQTLQRTLSEAKKSSNQEEFAAVKELFKKLQEQHDENLKLYYVEHKAHIEISRAAHEAEKAARLEWFNKNYTLPPHLIEVAKIADEANHYSNLDNEYSYYELTLLQ